MNVIDAKYKTKHIIEITFSTNESKEVDFQPFFDKNFSAHFEKYKIIKNFKKFYIDNGNIV